MTIARRAWLLGVCGLPGWRPGAAAPGTALVFPRDHGAHLETRVEWWYATGWLGSEAAPSHGLQLTFFRSRTGLAEDSRSRFAARQLLFADAAVTDLAGRRHLHAQRLARWSGDPAAGAAHAALDDTDLRLADWSLRRRDGRYEARLPADGFTLDLVLTPTQPLLLQGDDGRSRKGPREAQFSRYYSEPQLALQGRIVVAGREVAASGRAWLDREWSDAYLAADAVGWDWIGMNLFDGSALMAFRIRRAEGSTLWAGGSWRSPAAAARYFAPDEVRFDAGRRWLSPASQARYPVQWQLQTPAGGFEVMALFDAQELDGRAGTGAIYWEGLAELRDGNGRRVGLGYLEMTGYAGRLRMS